MKGKAVARGRRSSVYAILFLSWSLCLAGTAGLLVLSPASAEDGTDTHIGQFGFESTVPAEVWDAANDGLGPFLQAIPLNSMEIYGFPAGSDFDQITLGQPYRIMTIHPETLFQHADEDNIRSMVTATQMWLFPIVQRGQTRALLTIDKMNGEWKAVSIGCARIAHDLDAIEQVWPNDGGFERCLVRVFQATTDIMLIIADELIGIMPFESARTSLHLDDLGRDANELYSGNEIVERLIPVVQENIDLHRDH